MPRIRTDRRPPPPPGFEVIAPVLQDLDARIRAVGEAPPPGAGAGTRGPVVRDAALHALLRLHNQRTRYIYDLYYRRRAISREVYDYCVRERYADAALIAKWRKPGYERVCCLRCIQPRDTNNGTVCVCRVPARSLAAAEGGAGGGGGGEGEGGEGSEAPAARRHPCTICGCRGCASGD